LAAICSFLGRSALMAPIKRIGVIGFGHAAKEVLDWTYDYFIYGAVMIWATARFGETQGPIVCFLVMSVLTAITCLVLLIAYDLMKVDWLGIEWLKEVRDEKGKGFFRRLFQRLLLWSDFGALIFFSIWEDAFVTTAYLRRGSAKYNGMRGRDWRNFFSSVVISNVAWTLGWAGALQVGLLIFVRLPIDIQNQLIQYWDWFQTAVMQNS